jgi:lysophospholipase L1-like esterase
MTKNLFFLMVLVLCSCEQNKPDEVQQLNTEPSNTTTDTIMNQTPNTEAALTYLALGDSYTIGQSVPISDRYPVKLVELLKNKGLNYSAPKIIAQTGWTTDELKSAIIAQNVKEKYNLVTLLIGVNDQYRGREVEEFRIYFKELLEMALVFANYEPKKVLVISIPDWGVSPYAVSRDRTKISQEIDLYNRVKKEETEKRGIEFIDITQISRQALNNELYIASDQLHFSGAMYQLWANKILSQAFN